MYQESEFDGGLGGLIGISLGQLLLIIVTLGFGTPWAICMKERWIARHTVIDGKRLNFDGTGGQLFGTFIKWVLLSAITLGIYALWVPIKLKKWTIKHTHTV